MAFSEHFKADGTPKRELSQVKAYELIEYLAQEGDTNVTAYQCTYCDQWHIGHSYTK